MGERLERKRAWNGGVEGYSFLEYLMATTILTVAALSLIQTLALTLGNYAILEKRRQEILQRWNQSEEVRSRDPEGTRTVVVPGGPSLWRLNVSGSEEENALSWEVLRSLP